MIGVSHRGLGFTRSAFDTGQQQYKPGGQTTASLPVTQADLNSAKAEADVLVLIAKADYDQVAHAPDVQALLARAVYMNALARQAGASAAVAAGPTGAIAAYNVAFAMANGPQALVDYAAAQAAAIGAGLSISGHWERPPSDGRPFRLGQSSRICMPTGYVWTQFPPPLNGPPPCPPDTTTTQVHVGDQPTCPSGQTYVTGNKVNGVSQSGCQVSMGPSQEGMSDRFGIALPPPTRLDICGLPLPPVDVVMVGGLEVPARAWQVEAARSAEDDPQSSKSFHTFLNPTLNDSTKTQAAYLLRRQQELINGGADKQQVLDGKVPLEVVYPPFDDNNNPWGLFARQVIAKGTTSDGKAWSRVMWVIDLYRQPRTFWDAFTHYVGVVVSIVPAYYRTLCKVLTREEVQTAANVGAVVPDPEVQAGVKAIQTAASVCGIVFPKPNGDPLPVGCAAMAPPLPPPAITAKKWYQQPGLWVTTGTIAAAATGGYLLWRR